jgi:hypothetical protein
LEQFKIDQFEALLSGRSGLIGSLNGSANTSASKFAHRVKAPLVQLLPNADEIFSMPCTPSFFW